MKLEKFINDWSGAPISELDMAGLICKHLEGETVADFDLISKSLRFAVAAVEFRDALLISEIEMG